MESKKIDLPENSIKIADIIYWNILTQLFDEHREDLWYDASQIELDEKWLGLKEILYEHETIDNFRYFEVIDKEKYLWAKLKYGI